MKHSPVTMDPMRDFTMAMLSEDFAHEIAGAVSFFAGILTSVRAGVTLHEDDHTIAAEELARIETLLAGLRRTRYPHLERQRIALAALVDRARASGAAERHRRGIGWRELVAPEATIEAEPVLALEMLAGIADALAAIAADGAIIEVRSEAGALVAVAASPLVGRLPAAQPAWMSTSDSARAWLFAQRIARLHGLLLDASYDGTGGVVRVMEPRRGR